MSVRFFPRFIVALTTLVVLTVLICGSVHAQTGCTVQSQAANLNALRDGSTAGSIAAVTIRNLACSTANGVYTATGATNPATIATNLNSTINLKAWGAMGDAKGYTTGVMTSGSATFTDTTNAPFLPTDCTGGTGCTGTVNKAIMVDGAGAAGAPLSANIIGYTSASVVTLSANAGSSVPYSYASDFYYINPKPLPAVGQSGAGSYAPGNTITLTGGTATTQAVLTVTQTGLQSATVNAAGSGGTNGACVLTGTTGTSSTGPGRFTIAATIAGNVISSLGAITSQGGYTTNPTSVASEPVTSSCGLTGATLVLKMGVLNVRVSTLGKYSVFPTSPVAQGSTSGSGTGATFTLFSSLTGGYTFGTDDSAVFSAAITYAMSLNNGQQPIIYAPGGSYYMKGTTSPTITKSIIITGDGPHNSYFVIDPAYVGDLISTSDVWGLGFVNGMSPTADNTGVSIGNFTVIGNAHATGVQNAIALYDRSDFANISNVHVYWLHGQAILIGTEKNTTQAYMRESTIYNIKGMFCGTSALPCIHITSMNDLGAYGDSTNEIIISDVNVFNAASAGVVVDNINNTFADTRLIKFFALRIEQSNNGDNLNIGLSTNTGRTGAIQIYGLESISAPAGFWSMNFADSASVFHNYSMYVEGITFTGYAGGGGINIQDGQQMQFIFNGTSVYGYVLQTASSATVPFGISVDYGGSEFAITSNLGTAGIVKKPTWAAFP